jgi:hypothetical protein
MSQPIKQSTATAIVMGPFLDSVDGITAETALDVTAFTARAIKHSNTHPLVSTAITVTASGGVNDAAHIAGGYYSLELTAAQADTLGRLTVAIEVAGALPVWKEFQVLTANSFDTIYGADKWDVEAVLLQTQAKADVNAEVVDAIGVDTIAELAQAAPASTPTLKTAVMLLYMALRNKTIVTSSEFAIFNDADTKIAKSTIADDGTTVTIAELASGV